MTHTPVTSQLLTSVAYDPATKVLEVQFAKNGNKYQYADVPADIHAAMMGAESVGSYFLRKVKPKFTGTKVEDKKEVTQ